ncbi:Dihydrofolate reductase [Ascochyta rabiei]|nr:Dihydrofolate reductase [Ascochyta rabiei]UPX21029.1 Dihydrofolate reductase [Ascochyta rabiei]
MSQLDPSCTAPRDTTLSSYKPNTMPSKSLTLILAATPSLGIGKSGGLPWPQLKQEMGYFARVTKRTWPTGISEGDAAGQMAEKRTRMNAVVMGRKTWDSIPERFRPLAGRVNVVVTRDTNAFTKTLGNGEEQGGRTGNTPSPLVASSVSDALQQLQSDKVGIEVDKIMVIGGASIYEQALKRKEAKHVLLTKIQREYECDTFFSEDLDGTNWKKASPEELKEFTGEAFEHGTEVEEKDVRFEFCLYNRVA